MNRRQFVILTCGVVTGCAGDANVSSTRPAVLRAASIDAGPVDQYRADGVYDHHRDQGFFIIRHGAELEAISSMCTHRRCRLQAEPDHSFYCKCHGSTFDPEGKVTEGPAKRDLPVLPTRVDENGHLIILGVME